MVEDSGKGWMRELLTIPPILDTLGCHLLQTVKLMLSLIKCSLLLLQLSHFLPTYMQDDSQLRK